jgi:hypothetical protein
MFVHAVYFWLDRGLGAADAEAFRRRLEGLTRIAHVRHGFVGAPAATNRPVIDRTYSFALTLVFDHQAAQDAYQADPVHAKFVEDCSKMWIRVLIYDSE